MATLSWSVEWTCTNILQEYIGPCKYNVTIHFEMEEDSTHEQTVAFGRISSLFKEIFQNSVFISLDNPLLPTLKKKTKQIIATFPKEPTDSVIAAIIWYKIMAICEGRISLEMIEIRCDQSEDLVIHFDQDFAENEAVIEDISMPDWEEKPWWFRETPTVGDWIETVKKEKKFHIETGRWLEYLQWEEKEEKNKKIENNVLVFKPKWKPEVINGDKPKD